MAAPIDLENVFVREVERNDGRALKINQSGYGDVGCVVWDAALVLSKYLETADFEGGRNLKGKTVIELGAGTGVVGLMAASYGARVVITDLPEFLPLIDLNIEANRDFFSSKVDAEVLRWGQDSSSVKPDLVLLADCIYYKESLEPLVTTIDELCGAATTAYCCYEERTTGNKPELQRKFFELVRAKFTVTEVPQENQDEHFRSSDIHIMKFQRKPD